MDSEHQEGERGLFSSLASLAQGTSLSQLATSATGAVQQLQQGNMSGALEAVTQGTGLQAKLDAYGRELTVKVKQETERTVYEQAHEQGLADKALRHIIERGVALSAWRVAALLAVLTRRSQCKCSRRRLWAGPRLSFWRASSSPRCARRGRARSTTRAFFFPLFFGSKLVLRLPRAAPPQVTRTRRE